MSHAHTTALDRTPSNLNPISSLEFKWECHKTPVLNYFVQNINIPAIHMGVVEHWTPLGAVIKQSGDTITYDHMMLNFLCDEEFAAWSEIHDWMVAIGAPVSTDQYKNAFRPEPPMGHGEHVDASVVLLTNLGNPKMHLRFKDVRPIALSSIIFDVTRPVEEKLILSATFAYNYYEKIPV